MLDRQSPGFQPTPAGFSRDVVIGLPELLAFLRRQVWPIAAATAAFVLLGVLFLAITPTIYSASATLLIDPRKVSIFGTGSVLEDASISNSEIETQVEVLESGRIARAVVNRLDLTNDEVFLHPGPSSLVAVLKRAGSDLKTALLGEPGPVAPAEPATEAAGPPPDPVARAAGIVSSRLSASRQGLSYVIRVSYWSTDPIEAARLANAGAEAYLADQVAAQVQAAEQASAWLQGRLTDLQTRAVDPSLGAQEKSALRAIYDNFLERYTQTVQQQSMPFANAQILTEATVPTGPSSPKPIIVLLGAVIAGGVVGFGIGLARELLDKSVKTPGQVEAATGAPFLGFLPLFRAGAARLTGRARRQRDAGKAARAFVASGADAVAVSTPGSRYAETLRSIGVAVAENGRTQVIVLGVISAQPGEGRSTVAVNLARLAAAEGRRAILIDGDVRSPTLSATLAGGNAPGIAEIARGEARIADVIWTDSETRLQFLPAGDIAQTAAGKVLASPATQALIQACRKQFELVIVDLPAIAPVVDVRAAAHLFDGFVMVVEWGKTTEDALSDAVQAAGIGNRLLGTVLNKVNMKLLKRFDSWGRKSTPSPRYVRENSYVA